MAELNMIVLLVVLLSTLVGSTVAEDCKVPKGDPLLLTFKDFKEVEKGVIYGACVDVPLKAYKNVLLSVRHLALPANADLMIYKDGVHHPIYGSCSQRCPSSAEPKLAMKNKSDLIDEVKELQLSLEEEISNTEKFLASNEKIEERNKRKSSEKGYLDYDDSLMMQNDDKFEVKINRMHLEKMTRMKELADKYPLPGEKNIKKDSNSECVVCPTLGSGKLFELYLRLPKGLNCSLDNNCSNVLRVEIEASLVKEQINCTGGKLVELPSDQNNECLLKDLNDKDTNRATLCIMPDCSASTTIRSSSRTKSFLKARHSAKLSEKELRALRSLALEDNEVKIDISPSTEGSSCLWHFDTSTHKNVQIKVAPSLVSFLIIYEKNLSVPVWHLRHCPVQQLDSYWFTASTAEVSIVYHNPYKLTDHAKIIVHVRRCPPPPVVPNTVITAVSHLDEAVKYVCDAGLQINEGDGVLQCGTDNTWPTAPQCMPELKDDEQKKMSDAPDSTPETDFEEASVNSSISHQTKQKLSQSSPGLTDFNTNVSNSNRTEYEDYYDGEFEGEEDDYEEYYDEDNNGTISASQPNLDGNTILLNIIDSLDYTNTSESFDLNLNITHDGSPKKKLGLEEEVKRFLRVLSIDEELLPYVLIGAGLALLLLIIIIIVCCVLCKRRVSGRLQKFDTFQNPIYEKTVVQMPLQIDDDDMDEEKGAAEPLPVTSKAEMEDLSDSTGMD